MKQSKKWISVEEISDYCLVSKVTVRRWIKGDKMSAIRLPSGHYRVTIADFREFLTRYDMPISEEFSDSNLKKKGGEK